MTNRKNELWKTSSLAQKYIKVVRGAIPLAKEQLDIMMRLISARNEPLFSFLDLGCGSGTLAAAILEKYPEAKGVLLDFSKPMLQAAQEALKPYAPNIEFALVDYGDDNWVRSIPTLFPFDAIVSGFSIHHQTDQRKRELYAQIYELLKPGGIFVNIEHVSSPTDWVKSIFDDYFIDSLYAMHLREKSQKSRKQVSEEYYNRPDKEANILASVEVQCDWFRQIGYEDVDCYFKSFELAVFGGRRLEG